MANYIIDNDWAKGDTILDDGTTIWFEVPVEGLTAEEIQTKVDLLINSQNLRINAIRYIQQNSVPTQP